MTRSKPRRISFVERVLDGAARIDQFPEEVRAWQAGDGKQPLHEALGLDSAELLQVAKTPDALRYIVHARRFKAADPVGLETQSRVIAHATQLAAATTDPYLLAEVDAWSADLPAVAHV